MFVCGHLEIKLENCALVKYVLGIGAHIQS